MLKIVSFLQGHNDEAYLGTLSLSTKKKILGIILGSGDIYHSIQEANYILDIRNS